jgi:hypothetical protein
MGGGERERLVYALKPRTRSRREQLNALKRCHEGAAPPCQDQQRTRTAALSGSADFGEGDGRDGTA